MFGFVIRAQVGVLSAKRERGRGKREDVSVRSGLSLSLGSILGQSLEMEAG